MSASARSCSTTRASAWSATLHPNHTYEKVVFDPWRQETWDVNDTVAAQDRRPATPTTTTSRATWPITSPAQPATWQTWHAQRRRALGSPEQAAAAKAAVHARHPSTTYFDALGRPFLTVAHNRFQRTAPPSTRCIPTSVELDIEGNQREVIDAKGRVVMRYDYDMLGNRIHQASMEAGERWMLNDVAGNPIRAWDSRDHRFRTAYDPLRRPTEAYLREGTGSEILVGRTVYGESRSNPETSNLRGRVIQSFRPGRRRH